MRLPTKRAGRILAAKPGWHDIGGQRIYFRSKAEYRHALMLEAQKRAGIIVDWAHEPSYFDFPIAHGTTRYLPDFCVCFADGRVEHHEVKGYLDAQSKTKLRRMAKYYPEVTLKVFGARWPETNKVSEFKQKAVKNEKQ